MFFVYKMSENSENCEKKGFSVREKQETSTFEWLKTNLNIMMF